MTPEQLEGPLVHPGDLPTSPDIRKGLQTTPGHPEGTLDHSQTSGRGSRTSRGPSGHSGISWMVSRPLPDNRVGQSTTPGHPGRPPDNYRTSGMASRTMPAIQEDIPTTLRHPGGHPDHSRTSGRASHH